MLHCPNCKNKYDSAGRLPKLIPQCAHTICLECLSISLRSHNIHCSECQTNYHAFHVQALFQTNLALQKVIETFGDLCERHRAPKDQVCLADYQKICINCVNYDDRYKGQSTRALVDIRNQAKSKIQEITQKEAGSNQEKSESLQIIQSSLEKMKILTKNSFDRLKADETKKKRFLQWDIEAMFLMKEQLAEGSTSKMTILKDEITSSCRTIENDVITEEYLDVFNREIVYPIQFQQENYQDLTKKLQKNICTEIEKISGDQNLVLEKDYFKELCGRSADLQDPRMVLEVAQIRYFHMSLDNQDRNLIITPISKNSSHSESRTLLTLEQISNVFTVVFSLQDVKLTNETMNALRKIWNNVPSDVEVRVIFDQKHFKDADLISCSKLPFWESPSLQDLRMDFTRCSFQQATALPDFLAATLNKNNLKSLALFLESTNIDKSTIKSLSPLVEKLDKLTLWLDKTRITSNCIQWLYPKRANLKTFKLSLRGTKICDSALSTLSDQVFRNLPDLRELLLYLRETEVTCTGIDNLLKNLSSLTKLETLKLSLAETQIKDRNVQSLAAYFSESGSGLRQLCLDLDENEISKVSLGLLCSNLPKQVSDLILTLQGTRVTDQNVQILVAESFKNMPNLTLLHFSLAETDITEKGLLALCSFLENNNKLKELKLDFRATRLNDNVICHFINTVVPTISALKHCSFDINNSKLEKSTLDLVANFNKKYE